MIKSVIENQHIRSVKFLYVQTYQTTMEECGYPVVDLTNMNHLPQHKTPSEYNNHRHPSKMLSVDSGIQVRPGYQHVPATTNHRGALLKTSWQCEIPKCTKVISCVSSLMNLVILYRLTLWPDYTAILRREHVWHYNIYLSQSRWPPITAPQLNYLHEWKLVQIIFKEILAFVNPVDKRGYESNYFVI